MTPRQIRELQATAASLVRAPTPISPARPALPLPWRALRLKRRLAYQPARARYEAMLARIGDNPFTRAIVASFEPKRPD